MKNLFTNLMKNTAKRTQNTGGGASHEKYSAVAVWNDSRTTVNRRSNDGQSQRQYTLGLMKYAAMMALLLTLACGQAWGADPDYESYDWSSEEAMATGIAGNTSVDISVVTGGSDGNVSGHYYKALNSAIDGSSATGLGTYLSISSASQIDSVEIFFCPNGTSDTNLAWAGWGEDVTPSAEVGSNYGTTGSVKSSKSWANAVWKKIDLSSKDIYTIYISRQGKKLTNNGSTISNFGDNQTVNLLGLRVWLHPSGGGGGSGATTYDVNIADMTNGSVSASPSPAEEDETVTLTVTPSTGYELASLTVTGDESEDDITVTNNEFSMPAEDVTVSATFSLKNYTVTLNNQSATTTGTESVITTYNSNTNLTSAITKPTQTGYVFAGYFTATNGGGVQLIDPAGNWIASAGGNSTYTDGSKNWKNDGDLTLYACWMEYCPGMDMAAQAISLGSGEHKTWTGLTTNKILYSVAGNTTFDDSSDASNAYDGLKFKNSGDYILFLVQANSSLKLYFGYTDTKPKISINGGAESTVDVGSTGSKTPNQEVDFGTQTYDRLIKLRTVTSNTVVLQKIEITAPASTYTLTASATVINPMTEDTKTGGITATITNSPVSGIISGTSTSTSSNTFTVGGTTVTAPATVAGSSAECDECTYRFDSWENIPATVTADVSTIHAKYNTTYGISYYKDGGSWADAYSAPAYYVYGTGVSLPVAANITKSGYTFNGWDDGSSTIASIGNTAWGNISVTAKWLANPTSLTNGTTTYNSQEVSWTAGSTEAAWEVYVSTSSSTPAVDQSPTATPTSAAYKFRGLEASTTYYWWVRAKYSNTEKSAWVAGTSFTTSSAVRTFESGQKIYFKDASGNISGLDCLWKVSTSSGNVYAYFYDDAATPNEAWSTYGVEVTNSHWNEANAIYEFTVPQLDEVDHTWTGVIFTRGSAPTFVAKDGFFGQQTSNQTPNIGQNLYIQNTNAADGYGKYNGSWSKYAKNPALLGDFNDWNPDANVFENYSSNVGETFFVLDEASTTYDFKIIDGEDWYSYDNSGAGWTITNTNTTAQLLYTNNSGNMHITSTEAGEYMLKYNKSTHNFIAAYYPKERLVRGTIVYFDVRKETNWKSAAFSARYGWQHFDSGSEYSWDIKKNGTALEDWVYYAVVPDCKTIGKVEMKRLNPADEGGTPWCTALVAMASSRTSVLQNCLKEEKDKEDYCNDWTPQWTTYCPPTDEVTLSDNSTTVIAGTSGNGSKSTPYLVETGGTIKVTASADQLVDDDNMTKKFDFEVNKSSVQDGEGSTFNYSSLSNNTVYKVTVKSYNYYNSTSGTKTVSDTLYYKALNTYTITYNAGTGATGSHAEDLKIYGIAKALPGATFEKTGYTQTGWATEEGGSKAYELSADYTGNDDLDLYPVWTANTYSVTLNTNSGTINSGDVTSYTYGVGATLPTDVTRDHYRFAGWYDAEDLDVSGDEVEEIADDATDDKEYWAKWTTLYAITDGEPSNGSIAITDGSSAITEAAAGDAVYIVATPSSGYEFSEWSIYKTSDSKTTVSPAAATASTSFTMPAYAVTVDASFVVETYTLSYSIGTGATGSASGGTSAGSYAEGTTITVPAKGTLANTGYTFRGWTDGTTFYKEGQKFTINSNTILTAVWDPNSLVSTATYNFNSGNATGLTIAKTNDSWTYGFANETYNTIPILDSYFLGMSFLSSSTGELTITTDASYSNIDSIKFNSASTDNSNPKVAIYGVKKNGADSTQLLSAIVVSSGSTKTWRAKPYSLDLHSLSPQYSGKVRFKFTTGSSGKHGAIDNIAIYSVAEDANFDVTFNMKGHGSAIDSYVGVPTGKKIVAPTAPTAAGYTFGGWYTDSGCSTPVDWGSMTITADKTLYAKWTANSYTINYYDKGGSAFSGDHADGYPETHTYGTATTLMSASKDCYTLDGWYTSSSCTDDAVTSLGATDYTDAINLYAKWTLDLGVTTEPDETVAATVDVATEIGLTATGVSTYQWQVCDDDKGTNATDITGLDTEYSDYDEATLSFTPASAGTYYLRCKIADACSNVDYSRVVTVTATDAYDITMGTHTNGSFTIKVGSADAVSESTESGAGVSIAIAATPSSGYVFKNWEILDGSDDDITTTVGATATLPSTKFTMPSEAVTINAVFVATHSLTVSVSGGVGGSVSPTSTTVGETLTQSISATPSTGYNFSSWAVSGTGASLSSTTTNPTTFTMGTANATVTATFSAKTYSIELNAGNGTGGSGSVTMTYNSSSHTAITAPTLTGYSLVGWYTGAGGTGSMVMNASGVLQASVDGYTDGSANWTKDATCTLYAKYAAVYPEGYLYITDVMATPEAKAGYTITASNSSASFDGDISNSDFQSNHSGYQHWSRTTSSGSTTLSFSSALAASATAAGMTIDVWWGADDANRATTIKINGGDAQDLDAVSESKDRNQVRKASISTDYLTSLSSIQLLCGNAKAVWFRVGIKEIPGYLLTYDDGDGSGAPAATYHPNKTITLSSTAPTRSGYVFRGWQVGGAGTIYAPGASFSMPAAAVTLVAKWDGVCMNFAAATSGSSETPAGTAKEISTATGGYASALSGGSMTFLGRVGVIGCNNSCGLVFDSKDDELLTVTLSGAMLEAGAIIVLDCYSLKNSTTGKAVGFTINGNACVEGNYTTTENAYQPFTRTYVVKEDDGIDGKCTFTIEGATTDKVYLKSMMVAGCTSCTSITPTITGATTLYTYPSVTSTTLTLDKDDSTGEVTWSVTPASGVVMLSGSGTTATVTAVATGTATITASIDPDGEHCGASVSQEISVAGCDILPIASVVLTSNTTADEVNATAVISGLSGTKKLNDNGAKFGMTLSGDSPFKEGDIINITGTMDESPTSTTFAVYSSETASAANLLYTTTLSASASIDVNIEVTEDNLTALNTSKKVVVIRTKSPSDGQYDQNPHMAGIYLKRYSCSEGLAEFTGDGESALWNNPENWAGGKVPTIEDRVIVNKPMVVNVADAQAAEVILDQSDDNNVKLTINAGAALLIAETLAKTTDGETKVATEAADVIINSTRATGVGALIIGGETGTNAATMNFETMAKNDGGWVNQFVGSPFSNNTPYVDYALQLYKFVPQANGDRGWWQTHTSGTMTPFWGYNVLYNDNNYLDVTWTGTLNASESKMISGLYYNGSSETDNMFANSWTAPIHVGAIEDADLVNASKTLYMFNAGTPAQEEGNNGSNAANDNTEPGTYISIPIHTATYAGIGVIPSMQAFYVLATGSGASITLDYNKVVYTPALTSVGIVPNRAPRRSVAADEPEVIKLRVQSESGWAANTYVMGRADFAESYEDGWDGAYIEGESATPKLYTPSIDGNMFINCLPEIEGTVVGFRKGSVDNYYTCSFEYNGEDTWYLNDLKEQKSTLINAAETYEFVAEPGDTETRFVISATPIHKIATGNESASTEAAKVRKLIIDDKIYIIRGGRMYSVDGQMIK